MIDHADKEWLREKPRLRTRLLLLAAVLAVAWIVEANARQREFMVLLEPSSQAATLDECQRTHPRRGRPKHVISFQNGSWTNWHHRTCYYA